MKRAYLAQLYNPEHDEKPHTLIGIEVSGNWDQVVAEASIVMKDIEIPDPPVDFIQIKGNDGIDDYFLNKCQPFYKN